MQPVKDAAARLAKLGRPGPRDLLKLVYAQVYTDPRTREWEEHVEACVRRQIVDLAAIDDGQQLTLPLQGRVLLTLRFNIPKPKSYPKSVTMPTTARGDIDNMAKAVIDGIQNAQVIANDRLITDELSYRRYADHEHPAGVEIDLTGLA